jgi:hypothetical protein
MFQHYGTIPETESVASFHLYNHKVISNFRIASSQALSAVWLRPPFFGDVESIHWVIVPYSRQMEAPVLEIFYNCKSVLIASNYVLIVVCQEFLNSKTSF